MDILVRHLKRTEAPRERIDWNSLFLLLLLTVPAAVMSAILFAWPDVVWVAQAPYAAIEALGSFTLLLLAVFVFARYKDQPGTPYISAGLIGVGIIEGCLTVVSPQSGTYLWLHSFAGIFGGLCFLFYLPTRLSGPAVPRLRLTGKAAGGLIGAAAAVVAIIFGTLSIVLAGSLPPLLDERGFTATAWLLNALPIALFLVAGISLFYRYRRTGAQDVFLYTAIVIFLFQASEVTYFAPMWGIIWWFWQGFRLLLYLAVLTSVLNEYIQTSDSLTAEVAERQRAAIALRQAEEDWRNSFNSLNDAMLIVDRDYTIQRINESGLALSGKSPGEVTGKKCYQLFHNGDGTPKICPCRHSFRTGKVATHETYEERFGRHFFIKSAPLANGGGKPTKCVCLIQDITREVKAREKERELQQELNLASRLASIGEVAAGIAHEINNPLTGVIGFSQMLSGMAIPEEMQEAVEVIQDGARRTAGIVQKLLTFARRSKPTKEYLDVNAVLKSTIDIRAYEMRTNNIEMITSLADDLPRTMANFGQFQQVFLNLIINAEQAISAASRQGRIAVRSECVNGKIRVSISDNGIGISKENLRKLFDPFFTTKTDSGGTGLGLSISYGIIKEHGGTIRVKSAAAKGTTFTVEVPVLADNSQTPQPEAAPGVPAPGRMPHARILVVDDEMNICRVLRRLLIKEGHEVDIAHSALTALEQVKTTRYDLILMDIRMPGISGIELYSLLKDIDPSVLNRVVCITGDIISPKNKSFLEETRVPCVTKPFTAEALVHQINATLGGKNNA